jgi:copper chaperone CopZ
MTCSGCARNIKAYLRREPGVEDVQIDYERGIGTVTFDAVRTSEERILKSRIFSSQYRAEMVT